MLLQLKTITSQNPILQIQKKVFVKKEFTINENIEIKINKFLKLIANNIQKSHQEKDEFSNIEILSKNNYLKEMIS